MDIIGNHKEIVCHELESRIFNIIEAVMLKPDRLMRHMEFFRNTPQKTQLKFEKKLRNTESRIEQFNEKKNRILDLYSGGHLYKDTYINKCMELDKKILELNKIRTEIIYSIPILQNHDKICESVQKFCESAQERYEKCLDFKSKRRFLMDFVSKIIYRRDDIIITGHIPVGIKDKYRQFGSCRDDEQNSIEFEIGILGTWNFRDVLKY